MTHEHISHYNSILQPRTKNRVENFHKPTGITKLIERNYVEGNTRKGYDKRFLIISRNKGLQTHMFLYSLLFT